MPARLEDAIKVLYPTATWEISNGEYKYLKWYSKDIPKPALKELEKQLELMNS